MVMAPLLLLAACGSDAAPAVPTPTPSQCGSRQTALREFGAVSDSWLKLHPGTSRPGSYGGVKAPVTSISDMHLTCGRVDTMTLHTTPIEEAVAKQMAVTQLPRDARVVFEKNHSTGRTEADDQCYVVQYQSKLLAQAMGPNDKDGIVNVEISSTVTPQSPLYNPHAVTTIILSVSGSLNFQDTEC
jgi:hypothetical protein